MRVNLFVVLITLSSGAFAQDNGRVGPREGEHRMREYLRIWEGNKKALTEGVNTYYAERVTYYGRNMTRLQVLADKLRFHRAYPQRSYDIAPGSLRTKCAKGVCQARAELLWVRTHTSGRREHGASDLRLSFSAGGGKRIVRESAKTLLTHRQ